MAEKSARKTKAKKSVRKPKKRTPAVPSTPRAKKSATPGKVGRPPLPANVVAERAVKREARLVEIRRVNAEMEAAKQRYICGFAPPEAPEDAPPVFESLRALSEGTGVPLKTLQTHCAEEGWVDQRLDLLAAAAAKAKKITTRKLALQVSHAREEAFAGARLGLRKAVDNMRSEQLSMQDLNAAQASISRGLDNVNKAADPDAAAGVVPLGGSGSGWALIRRGLDPVTQGHIIDVLPEEDDIDL
jgi:hypothetical protein